MKEEKKLFDKKQIEQDLKEIKGKNENENGTILSKESINFYMNLVEEWISDSDDSLYLGCAKNKLGDMVVILYRYNAIYLLGESYKTIMYAPKIMFHRLSDTHLHIDDVLTKTNNVGNGSILMRSLIKYAEKNEITMITGDLSNIDNDHKERRDYYYKKFGFEVSEKSIQKLIGKDEK